MRSKAREYADTIARELKRTLDQDTVGGRQLQHLYPLCAAEKAATACGWDRSLPLQEWYRQRFTRTSTRPVPSALVEQVTTRVMVAWLRKAGSAEDHQDLIRPLVGVAHARGRCEGKPLGLWMLERARSPHVRERKAIAEATRLMATAPPLRDEMVRVLSAQLTDPNRLVRVTAAETVAQVGTPFLGSGVEQALIACLQECVKGVVYAIREPLRPARNSEEFEVYAADLRGNYLDAFAWTAAAAAFGSLGLSNLAEPIVAELRQGLGCAHWLVRTITAAVLCRVGRGVAEARAATALLSSLESPRRQEGLRRLQALASVGPLPQETLPFLLRMLNSGDLCIRAATYETLGIACRVHPELLPQLREKLQDVLKGEMWPLYPLAESVLTDIGQSFGEGDILRQFYHFLTTTAEPARSILPPETTTAKLPEEPVVGCLCIQYEWNDMSELGQATLRQRMIAVEQTLRSSTVFLSGATTLQKIQDRVSILMFFFEGVEAGQQCTEQVSRQLVVRHPLRMALHAGTDIRLKRLTNGDWALEGALIAATRALCRPATAGQVVVSDKIKTLLEKQARQHAAQQAREAATSSQAAKTLNSAQGHLASRRRRENKTPALRSHTSVTERLNRFFVQIGRLVTLVAIVFALTWAYKYYFSAAPPPLTPQSSHPAPKPLIKHKKISGVSGVSTEPAVLPQRSPVSTSSTKPTMAEQTDDAPPPASRDEGSEPVVSANEPDLIQASLDGIFLDTLQPVPHSPDKDMSLGENRKIVRITLNDTSKSLLKVEGYDSKGHHFEEGNVDNTDVSLREQKDWPVEIEGEWFWIRVTYIDGAGKHFVQDQGFKMPLPQLP